MRHLLCLAMMAVALSGCATVVRGTDETVAFVSEPPGAAVTMTNGFQCVATPCRVKMPRKDEFTATFTKPGFEPMNIDVGTELKGGGAAAAAGNVLAGGVIGLGVDQYNGAELDHDPNPVFARMKPLEAAPAAPARKKALRGKKQRDLTS